MRRFLPDPLYLLLILAPLGLLSPLILSGSALFWGTPALQFTPWRFLAWELLKSGELPLWNPLNGMGAPLLANYQSALVYPPTWFLFALSWIGGIGWAAWGQALLVWLHWCLAGMGMARLAGGLGLGRLSRVISGLAFGLGGYLVARAGFLSINAAVAWLPWMFYFAGQVASPALRREGGRGSAWIKFSLVAALQLLAGHAQTAWYTCLGTFLWAGYWGWLDVKPVGQESGNGLPQIILRIAGFFRTWAVLGSGYLLAGVLAAVQLLPTAEYLAQSQRASEVTFDYAMTYSFWGWRLLTLIAPGLFGNPAHGDYWGYANYWEDALYLGLLPLLLAIAAIIGWGRRLGKSRQQTELQKVGLSSFGVRNEAVPFLLAFTLMGFLLALGKNTPLYPWLYRHIPTFDMFQAPTRFSLWVAFSLALLAGFGAHAWRRPQNRALYWTRLGTAGAFAISLGAALTWLLMGEVSPTFIQAVALAGFWGVGAGLLSLLAPPTAGSEPGGQAPDDRRKFTIWVWAVGVFIALDLIVAGWGLNPGIPANFYSRKLPANISLRDRLAGRRLYLPIDQEDELKFKRFLRFDTFYPDENWDNLRAVLLPNLNLLDHISSLNNFDPLVPGRYAVWMRSLSQAPQETLWKLLDLSGAGMVEEINPAAPAGVSLRVLPKEIGRRARWVACASYVENDADSLQAVLDASFDPERLVIIEADDKVDLPDCTQGVALGKVKLLEEKANRLVFEVQSDAPGWLLLADIWYPGWRAQVDQEDSPIFRADYLFRAVWLPEGEHQVVFDYRPLSFWVGFGLSLAGWFGLASYALSLTSRGYRARRLGFRGD